MSQGQSVVQTPSTGLRHPSFKKVPESDAWSVSVVPKRRVTLHVYVQQSVTGCGKWLPTLASHYLSTATLYASYSCLLHFCPSRPRRGKFFPSFCFSPKYTKYNHKQNDFKPIREKKLLPPGSKGVVFL